VDTKYRVGKSKWKGQGAKEKCGAKKNMGKKKNMLYEEKIVVQRDVRQVFQSNYTFYIFLEILLLENGPRIFTVPT
jgi:hypothetical protein